MINKQMNNKNMSEVEDTRAETRKPNETGGFYFSSSVKIFDPNTEEVIIHKRGDI